MSMGAMTTQKIAITVPPIFLMELDSWAKKSGKSRSRFIVEEMSKRLMELEDEDITKLYNQAYGNPEDSAEGSDLAEEMLAAGSVHEEGGKW
jgi:metal-responsive CopG/Arc/MetJ family transcriptional regulator